jgi:16S rRNA (guanine527-N7)-methyltransferase
VSKKAILRDRILRGARRARLELADGLVDRLCVYVELLSRWNQKMNLTALDEREVGLERLLIEPLAAARHLPAADGRLVDIGSGGGSPAIPMTLAAPNWSLLMVESKIRKSAFLREACRHLELSNATVHTGRYESLFARPELHEAHDVLSVRAVRVDAGLLRGLQAFVKPEGQLFLFRSSGVPEVPKDLQPPLAWRATYAIGSASHSRLVVLEKLVFGRFGREAPTEG